MTVKLWAVPAVTDEGKPLTCKLLAAAGFTVIPAWVPEATVGLLTVIDWLPAVTRVAEKVCTPPSLFVNV